MKTNRLVLLHAILAFCLNATAALASDPMPGSCLETHEDAPVGAVCMTKAGYLFKRFYDGFFNETGWTDLTAGLSLMEDMTEVGSITPWIPRKGPDGALLGGDWWLMALRHCQRRHQFLPSVTDFETLEKHGYREIFWDMFAREPWTSTLVPGDGSQAYAIWDTGTPFPAARQETNYHFAARCMGRAATPATPESSPR
ncbi:MAG TPA: hypothetical protein VL588_06215 [Bdellovibrionota bacterium]|jgi:hypothetical protein|nr:hypothetical protein [Bdellovibrionota bacterium]